MEKILIRNLLFLILLASLPTVLFAQETSTEPDLLVHYKMLGSPLDQTGNYDHIVWDNPRFNQDGLVCNGGYILDDSTGTHAETPYLSELDLNNFTISIWFNTSNYPAYYRPVIVGSRLYRWMAFYLRADGTVSMKYNNDNFADSTVQYQPGTWHHAMLTYDGVTGKLYLDGELACQADFVMDHANRKDIGTTDFSNARTFEGVVSDLKVYNRVLEPAN